MSRLNTIFLSITAISLYQGAFGDMPQKKSEFYGAALVGFNHFKADMTNTYDSRPIGNPNAEVYNQQRKTYNPIGSVLLGYRYFIQKMVVGFDTTFSMGAKVEAQNNFQPTDYLKGRFIDTKVKQLYTITPALFMGYKVEKNVLVYGRLGLSIGRYETHLRDTGHPPTRVRAQTKYGFSPTLGVEYAFNPYLSFCVQGTWDRVRNLTHKSDGFSDPVLNKTSTDENRANVTIYSYQIGLIYKF